MTGHAIRSLLVDAPLCLLLLLYVAVHWISYVGNTYLVPQYYDLLMTDERLAKEMTYYVRDCSKKDLSTLQGMDLFLPSDATVEDAYQHQLRHGFTVFRSVLSPTTAKNLRDHVTAKNYNLTEQESIYVIENNNRYSFGLGTDEPAVAAAVKEVTTHPLLKASMDKIIGPSSALIEMTAITASYGAVHQWWHDDIVPWGSPIRHARAYGPSYAIFIQLQNTTKEMGATGACPGTHYCSGGSETEMCGREGFQLVNEEGHWATGDALLMNMNSFHRGSAHTDPNAPDRVMFILTLVPKPKEIAESRRMSQGITFSLRWDMWGHTWDDLARADEYMGQPWATLRSLALYKPKDAVWGIDWFASSSMRSGGMETGFNDQAMEKFQRWGQLAWLPRFLQENDLDPYEEHVWVKYAVGTVKKVLSFVELIVFSAVGTYIVAFALAAILRTDRPWLRSFSPAIVRLGIFCGLAFALFKALSYHVDSTRWAADIRGHRRYSHAMGNELAFGVKTQGITTLPHRNDVLIENRFGSRYLYMYNDFINGHPGNRYFLRLVDAVAPTFASYPKWLQDASARYIVDSVLIAQARFLEQGARGDWYLNDYEEALRYTKSVLVRKSLPLVGEVLQELRYITSGYRFSTLRDTKLAQKHMAPFLKNLENKIVSLSLNEKPDRRSRSFVRIPETEAVSPLAVSPFQAETSFGTPGSNAADNFRSPPFKLVPSEPEPGAWFSSGSVVEAFTDGFWFIGNVEKVNAFASYHVTFPDGEADWFGPEFLRVFEPYKVGERLQVYQDDMYDYDDCEIVAREDDGTYHVILTGNMKYYDQVEQHFFRRFHTGSSIEKKTYVSAYE